MNYRHAFHVGNHADVLKHAVLLFCLDLLARKPAPFAVLDTHAGRGLYNLTGSESDRSPEWRDGVGKLWDWQDPPALIAAYLDAIRSFNADGALATYPGSPALVARALRADDVLMACELHHEEYAALRRCMPRRAGVQLHERDGWEAMGALLPPKQRRGLVLIDPPYEATDELLVGARAIGAALTRFTHGLYLWWRPLKAERALDAADAEVTMAGARSWLRADLWVDTPRPEGKLVGASIFLVNPPFGLDARLREALPPTAERLSLGAHGWRITASS